MHSVSLSIKGTKRAVNQDSYHADDQKGIYIVADGMGGHKAGEVASRLAVKIIIDLTKGDKTPEGIARAFREANKAVVEKSKESPDYNGMGTTAVGCFVEGDDAIVAHVGDSRLYLVRGGEIMLLTKDHSLVEKMVESGQLSESEAGLHPWKNVIYKAIGMSDSECFDSSKDMSTLKLHKGDIIILCSDGLCGSVSPKEIHTVCESTGLEGVPSALADLAVKNGSTDDITIVAVVI